jgi:hypothetical protein
MVVLVASFFVSFTCLVLMCIYVVVVLKVEQAWNEYPAERSNRVFLTHQTCMVEVMKLMGEHRYKIPHIRKGVLQSLGILPEVLNVDPAIVNVAREYVNAE